MPRNLTNIMFVRTLIITVLLQIVSVNLLAQKQAVKLNTYSDSLQYSLGVFLGMWLNDLNVTISSFSLFNRGMTDVFNNFPLAVPDSITESKVAELQYNKQKEDNRKFEAKLFQELRDRQGVGVLPSGVHYIVEQAGNGIRPTVTDSIVINAVGIFPDGTIFEDSYKTGQPIKIRISNLIRGLNEAIQLMPEGSVWRIYIPSSLAYGAEGFSTMIPPYSALIYDISLEQVINTRD